MNEGGQTGASPSGWTIDTLATHMTALTHAEERLQQERDLRYEERDRRYAEVATEREKALKIKETADLAALSLAREIQTYKDEKANELREQISSERGNYASKGDLIAATEKIEATLKPLAEFVAASQGRQGGIGTSATVLVGAVSLVLTIIAIASAIYFSSHRQNTPIVVTTPTVTTSTP